MNEQLPGLQVHINEGRVTGTFELPPADMQHIRYQGRVVLVLVADVMSISVKDTKEGDTKASWTFKGVDAAIVRDEGTRNRLAQSLYLDGLDNLDPDELQIGQQLSMTVESEPALAEEEDEEIEEENTTEVVERFGTKPPVAEFERKDKMLERFLNGERANVVL